MSLRLPDSNAASEPDGRRIAPSAERNLPHILEALARHAPASGTALELASGTGQQITAFAAAHPALTWQATDRDSGNLTSIRAWARHSPAPNLAEPLVLDAGSKAWSSKHGGQSLVIMVNLLHLIRTETAQTVLAESAAALSPSGRLMIYGPFLRNGHATSDGDATFNASLQAQDPLIGYKDIDWVIRQLQSTGLNSTIENMPANNLMLIAFKT